MQVPATTVTPISALEFLTGSGEADNKQVNGHICSNHTSEESQKEAERMK